MSDSAGAGGLVDWIGCGVTFWGSADVVDRGSATASVVEIRRRKYETCILDLWGWIGGEREKLWGADELLEIK